MTIIILGLVKEMFQLVDTQRQTWTSKDLSSCRLWNLKRLESRGNMKSPQKTLKT
jgi:hypothetical protein